MMRKIHLVHSWLPWKSLSIYIILVIILTCCSRGISSIDLCSDNTQIQDLKSNFHLSSIPKSGAYAGVYTKDKEASNILECVLNCCKDTQGCDSAFFHKSTCYLIKCNVTVLGACDAMPRTEPKYNETYYVNVREVFYETCDLTNNEGCNAKTEECRLSSVSSTECVCKTGFIRTIVGNCIAIPPLSKPKDCEYPLDDTCPKDEVCFVPLNSKKRWGTCVCRDGYARNDLNVCIPKNSNAQNVTKGQKLASTSMPLYNTTLKACEYGLQSCGEHQECHIPVGSKKRVGICVCIPDYHMNSNYNCVPSATAPTAATSRHIVNTTPKETKLTVSAGDNVEIKLPTDKTTLNCYVVEKAEKGESFHYEWTLVASPAGSESGTMVGKNTDKLTISKLIAGLYTFKIEVTGHNRHGEAFVNVTVSPPTRKNSAPTAVIKPKEQVVKLPNSAILDGSDSFDDDKIVKYLWEETSGPLQDHKMEDDQNMLTLKDLAPGTYIFKLTVTDSDGATNSTIANVTVIKETDYPPKANAGSDVIVYLPQDSVILYGNQSTDDKGIKSYEWIKSADDKLTADMTGTTSPYLHLSNLKVGDYTFTLKVTDTAGQSSSATMHLFVKPDINTPPVAKTEGTVTKFLPLKGLVLDGRNSTDDKKVVKCSWIQTDGPKLKILKADNITTVAVGNIIPDHYKFSLTVYDEENMKSTEQLIVTVKELPNEKPVSHAGDDFVLSLPLTLVKLDGSESSDDKGIVHYEWKREPSSLAAGDVVNGSDHSAVLQLVNVVAGKYIFSLTVFDAEGLSDKDTVSLLVKEDEHENDLLEMTLDTNLKHFTEEDKTNLINQITLMLPKTTHGETSVEIQRLQMTDKTSLHVSFYVKNKLKDAQSYRQGVETLKVLKEKLASSNYQILNFKVLSLDTAVCQNNCSGHGHCDARSKLCVCEAFWMQNFFVVYIFKGESNCDWSVLYVVIVSFLVVVSLAALVWGLVCWIKKRRCRCYRWKTKKRHRYSLLQEVDDAKDEIKLLPKGKTQNSSLMMSESEITSEEETLFINHKKTNGFIQKPLNGLSKQHIKTKLRT